MEEMILKNAIENAILNSESVSSLGEVATYIPALGKVDPDNYGVCLTDICGNSYAYGDEHIRFSIQSISKVFSLILALMDSGRDEVYKKVGTEPTKYQFNSLIPIDDRASNPMINAGALTTTSLIYGNSARGKSRRLLELIEDLSGSEEICVLEEIYRSELASADRNLAISYYLRSKEIFTDPAEIILDAYTRNCSIGMNIRELAKAASILANGGIDYSSGKILIPKDVVQVTLAQMASCGMYEESGEFLLEVGFPAKSGVGGAIMGIVPGKCGICTYAPRLDVAGNSVRGKFILEELSKTLDFNIFA